MSEPGESTEVTNELIMDTVQQDDEVQHVPRWHSWVAMSTLVMALFAAIGALLAGITAHEILLDRTEAMIALSISQSDKLNMALLETKHEILVCLGETPDVDEIEQLQAYQAEAVACEDDFDIDATSVQTENYLHLIYSIAVTVLAVAISLSGMAIIIELKWLWYGGLLLGGIGILGVGAGIMMTFLL